MGLIVFNLQKNNTKTYKNADEHNGHCKLWSKQKKTHTPAVWYIENY